MNCLKRNKVIDCVKVVEFQDFIFLKWSKMVATLTTTRATITNTITTNTNNHTNQTNTDTTNNTMTT